MQQLSEQEVQLMRQQQCFDFARVATYGSKPMDAQALRECRQRINARAKQLEEASKPAGVNRSKIINESSKISSAEKQVTKFENIASGDQSAIKR